MCAQYGTKLLILHSRPARNAFGKAARVDIYIKNINPQP